MQTVLAILILATDNEVFLLYCGLLNLFSDVSLIKTKHYIEN